MNGYATTGLADFTFEVMMPEFVLGCYNTKKQ
jgi:hypothetical protein